jgi:hypothetical protein
MRRKTDTPSTGSPAPAADFKTVLKEQPDPAPTAMQLLFNGVSKSPAQVAAPAAPVMITPLAPTAQSLFGDSPWQTDAGGTGPGVSYGFNPYFFATPATAAKVAQMLGGKVVAMDTVTPFGPFKQNQPNLMVQMPDGKLINAGLVAGFYDHGFTQQMVDKMIHAEVSGEIVFS